MSQRNGEPQAPTQGVVAPGFEPVARMFRNLLDRGNRGGALSVLRGEEILVEVWRGAADAGGRRPWTRDTPALGFSTTKGLTATVLHRLADRGALDYDEPVATYWPEFAAQGKGSITVADVLAHRAGLHDVRAVVRRPEELLDHLGIEDRLAAARPAWRPGPPGYHALTFGWLAAGLARRITGRGIGDLVQREIVRPLRIGGLAIGRGPGETPAEVVGGSLRLMNTLGGLGAPLWSRLPLTRPAVTALHTPGLDRLITGPDAAIWDTEMPAVNGALTAAGLARLYSALAHGGALGGRRLLSEATVDRLGRVQSRSLDRVLVVPMRWRLGYHQAFGLGELSTRAFGHYGFGGSGGWADPDSGLSLGYVTNDIGTVTTPVGDLGLWRLSALARSCASREAVLADVGSVELAA